jgi:adenylosuccinate synthase
MAKQVILLSGPVAAGKTTLGELLVERYGFRLVKTRHLIQAQRRVGSERGALQRAGDALDRGTNGQWLAIALDREIARFPEDAKVLVDAVRLRTQADAIRDAFGQRVIHIHLTAPQEVLAAGYASRRASVRELPSYEDLRKNKTERDIDKLAPIADIVIDTQRNSPADVLVRAAGRLGLYGRSVERLVDVLVGGEYGSEGKGHIASYLAPEYEYLVRVGGPNAGHKVFEVPAAYTFHQLPSGTRCSEAKLILGPGAVLSVKQVLKEIADCEIGPDRLFIDPQALIIEDADIEVETALVAEIGSTGQGVGAATARKVLRTLAQPAVRLAGRTPELAPYVRRTLDVLEDAFSCRHRVLLEGTQGTGLSLHHGVYPHVTSRETSGSGCLSEAGIAPTRVRRTIMVIRTYPIRVQNPARAGTTSGHMEAELDWETISARSGVPIDELTVTELTSTTKKKRRVSEFDWTLLRKAASLNGPTDIALTFADYITIKNRDARRFEQLSAETLQFIEEVERVAGAPVSLIGTRFDSRSIIDRRAW